MVKPEDIPQRVWDEALKAMPPVCRRDIDISPFSQGLREGFARAILAAEKREREACAAIASTYGANMSIWMSSEWPTAKLSANYAGQDIAQAIRNRNGE